VTKQASPGSDEYADYARALKIILSWRTSPERLPEDFAGWEPGHWNSGAGMKEISFDDHMPLVRQAILEFYPLPANFKLWDMLVSSESGWRTVSHIAATRGYPFPEGFGHWALKNSAGEPVIHTLIRNFNVPPAHFTQWSISTEGHTAAHAYLRRLKRPLPESFNEWLLGDRFGVTVAECAILMSSEMKNDSICSLPKDRELWLRSIEIDTTLFHLGVRKGISVPDIFSVDDWHLSDDEGNTVIDLARKYDHGHLIAQYEATCLAARVESEHATRVEPPFLAARIPRNAP